MRISSALLLLTLLSGNMYAQILSPGRVGARIANKVINKTADKMADKAADALVDKMVKDMSPHADSLNKASKELNTAQNRETMRNFGQLMGSMSSAPPAKANYSFNSSYEMKSTANGKSQGSFKYHFSNTGSYVGTEILESPELKTNNMKMVSIVDFETGGFYTFMNQDGTKNMMGFSLNATANTTNKIIGKEYKFSKTAQTKTIAGFLCDAYLMEQGDNKTNIWMSRTKVEVIGKYFETYKKMNDAMKISGNKNPFNFDYTVNAEWQNMLKNGQAMLGIDGINSKGQIIHSMEVTKISPNDNWQFSSAGYSSMMGNSK